MGSPETMLFERQVGREDVRPVGRRSELEVRMDILRVTSEGADKPTQIMYKANLSWTALLGHLRILLDGGFLTEVRYGDRRKYEITSKGTELLQRYEDIASAVRNVPAISLQY